MVKPRVLSLCTGMGLMDRAFLDAGFEVVAGCELDPDQRGLYRQLCGGDPLCHDLADLPSQVRGRRFAGVIGGPPCQSHTKLRAMRTPKFPDETAGVRAVLDVVQPAWFVFENVNRLALPGAAWVRLDAMHFGYPHQSRPRWFTHSPVIPSPEPLFSGTVDDLMAYSVVAGRIYGPKRGAVLQGYPRASRLDAKCVVLQKGLANAVHYGLASAWAARCLAVSV